MGKPKSVKKSNSRDKRYVHIHEDKPLTEKERKFTVEYLRLGDATKAAVAAGYSEKSASRTGSDLVNHKPNTRKAIAELSIKFHDKLEHSAVDVLRRLEQIAFGKHHKLTPIVGGRVVINDTETMDSEALALFAGAKERVNESGDVTVEVKSFDSMAALRLLCQYHGLFDSARRSKHDPLEEQKDAIHAVRSGEKSVLEACLDLESAGIPLPETLRILLTKYAEPEESDDDGDIVVPTAEEMEAERKKRINEIEEQREQFLPKRQKEIRELKKSLGEKNEEFGEDGKET